jgi:hypothetical protein
LDWIRSWRRLGRDLAKTGELLSRPRHWPRGWIESIRQTWLDPCPCGALGSRQVIVTDLTNQIPDSHLNHSTPNSDAVKLCGWMAMAIHILISSPN